MKKIYLVLEFLLLYSINPAQNFTWVKGINTGSVVGSYGTLNVPASANNPGARHGCATWTDAAGNLWLFGGEGYSSSSTISWLNDLWKYNPATNEWTWIRGSTGANAFGHYGQLGVPSTTNQPGAREFAASWTDAAGNFWLFGGDGFASPSAQTFPQRLGDLWRYNPLTNEWTWMSGFSTTNQSGIYGTLGVPAPFYYPGCRATAAAWTDNAGDLWIFGGLGLATSSSQGRLNDLWKYEISSSSWTWVNGTNITNQNGVYGTLGNPAPANMPGSRSFPSTWTGTNGDLYLFGGDGYGVFTGTFTTGPLNDLWKFDISTGQWTWLNGSNGINTYGVYGTQNVSSASNIAGARYASASWSDNAGNLWLFGGYGCSSTPTVGILNDLFKYNPLLNEWTWMKGSNTINQNGTYGTQGVSATANVPGSRFFNTYWKGADSRFWLFGGEGYDAGSSAMGSMNDLWVYSILCNPDSIVVTPGKKICSGSSVTLTTVGGSGTVNWYTTALAGSSVATGSILNVPALTAPGASTVYSYFAESNNCTEEPRAAVSITVNTKPTLTLTALSPTLCQGQTTTLMVSGASSYFWMTTSPTKTTTSIVITPPNSTGHAVIGMDANGCRDTASINITVNPCLGLEKNYGSDLDVKWFPNPANGIFTISIGNIQPATRLFILNAIGENVYEQHLNTNETTIHPQLAKGLYTLKIHSGLQVSLTGKLILE